MHNNKNAFTLIELLVVVLIIGILAAIALPQYQVAVAKSKLTAVIPKTKALKDAAEMYFLNHGNYTDSVAILEDINFPDCTPSGSQGWLSCGYTAYDISSGIREGNSYTFGYDAIGYILTQKNDNTKPILNFYSIVTNHSQSAYKNQTFCGAKADDNVANKVCQSLGGTFFKNANLYPTVANGQAVKIYKL
jgi:type IV pilus assembly protein PilE